MAKDKEKKEKKGKEEKPKKDKKEKGKEEKPKKDKAEKAEKKEAAPAETESVAGASTRGGATMGGGDAPAVFSRFDTGGKGFLDRADVAKLLAEVGSGGGGGWGGGYGGALGPRVGPFASTISGLYNGGGAGIYGPAGGLRPPLSYGPAGGLSGSRMGTPSRSGMPITASGPLGQAASAPGPDASNVALAAAYQSRMAALSSVAASLLGKREALAHTLARVQARAGDVAGAREAIERETLADAEATLHRLRASESAKQAVLGRDAETLAGDMAAIDRFYAALTSFQPHAASSAESAGAAELSAAMSGMGLGPGSMPHMYDPATALEFMRAYPELCAEADRLTGKAIKGEIDVSADDFERETASRLDTVGRYAGVVDLVAAKDRIILQLLKEREVGGREREVAAAVLDRAAAEREGYDRGKQGEVEHWMRIADKLTDELNDVMDRLSRAQAPIASEEAYSSFRSGGLGMGGRGGGGIGVTASGRLSFGGGPVPGQGLPVPPPNVRRAAGGAGSGPSAFAPRGASSGALGAGVSLGASARELGSDRLKVVPGLRPDLPAPLPLQLSLHLRPSPEVMGMNNEEQSPLPQWGEGAGAMPTTTPARDKA